MSDTTTVAAPARPGAAPAAGTRRTFAIISHPDAGKTTLTEKLLLYGGAVQLAGSVTARKTQRHAASDWMEIEQERGISITSTVLAFPYRDYHVNLLDTPGHQDFSEDTYRTLTAVDSAVMVLDAARGIEPQTLKLFEVTRRRRTPIFTFVNKLDRPAQHPLELLEEILLSFDGTILLVSHDRRFLDNVVTSSVVFEGAGVVREYVGGYADWLRQRPRPVVAEKAERPAGSKPASADRKAGPKKLSYKLQRELDQLPAQLEAAEAELERLQALTSEPDFYAGDQAEIAKTLEQLQQQEQLLETLMERWVELESMQEGG